MGILAGAGAMAPVLRRECDELKVSHVFHAVQRPFLKRYLKEHRIDVVNAHSYTQAKVIFPVCKALGIKTVITPHGARTPKRLKQLAPMFESCDGIMVIDEQLARLYHRAGVPLQRLFLSRLFLDWPEREPRRPAVVKTIGVCSRLSGLKGPMCEAFLRGTAKADGYKEILIFGDGSYRSKIEATAKELNLNVRMVGAVPDAASQFEKVDVLAGSSFVALEGFRAGCAVIGLGFDGCTGVITRDKVQAAIAINFGDRALKNLSTDPRFIGEEVTKAMAMRASGETNEVSEAVKAECSSKAVSKQIDGFFECVKEGRDYSDFSIPFDPGRDPTDEFALAT